MENNPYLDRPVQSSQIKTVISGSEMDLKDIIQDNIIKIKENPDYISQATAINDQVKTLIDLAKTQLLAAKLYNK